MNKVKVKSDKMNEDGTIYKSSEIENLLDLSKSMCKDFSLLLDILYTLKIAIFNNLHSQITSPDKVYISLLNIQSSGFVYSISLVRVFVNSL